MQKLTCPASMPCVAHNKYLSEGKNRWGRGHAWLMLIEAMFVPSTVKILFSTYLPCEKYYCCNSTNVSVCQSSLMQAPAGEVHSAPSQMQVVPLTFVANHPPLFCMSVSCPCDHTADTSNLVCLHSIEVPHPAMLLDEALPKGTPMLEVR